MHWACFTTKKPKSNNDVKYCQFRTDQCSDCSGTVFAGGTWFSTGSISNLNATASDSCLTYTFWEFAVAGACYPTALPGTYLQLGNYIYSYSCVRLHKCFLIWLWLYDVIKWIPSLLPQQIGGMWINKALNCCITLYLRDHCKTNDYATVCNCFMGVHVLFISLSGDFSAHSCLLFVHSFSFKPISKDPCHFDCCTFHVQFHLFSKNPGPDLCLLPLY